MVTRKEYQRQWYERNKEKVSAKNKQRYLENKKHHDALNKANRKEWASRPEVAARLKQQRVDRYDKHRAIISEVQLHYGCRNPDCSWVGGFESCDLDYHHFDSSKKTMQVSQMATCKLSKILEEINRCVILCAICHRRFHAGKLLLTEEMLCNVRCENGILLME